VLIEGSLAICSRSDAAFKARHYKLPRSSDYRIEMGRLTRAGPYRAV
jgi:hypothetical protein